jgi:hypothetical protein
LLVQPGFLESMTTRDGLLKPCAYYLPSLSVVVQLKYANQLLEMIVNNGMIHALIDVI